MLTIEEIAKKIESQLINKLNGCGVMFRLFSRVKTPFSIANKVKHKGELYRSGKAKIADIIGLRIVVYFTDDVEVLSLLLNNQHVVKRSVDEPDSCTFSPQRLNLTSRIPEEYIDDFRAQLPAEFASIIDETYEIQIRTIFSEGWHEVEHDLRYKCKEDWVGYEPFSRTLNGVIATLETAEWTMHSLFHEMAFQNLGRRNYTAMLRNKLRIRLKGKGLSPYLYEFLNKNPEVAEAVLKVDRVVFILVLLKHEKHIELTYDNVLFLMNRIDIMNGDLMALEGEKLNKEITEMLRS